MMADDINNYALNLAFQLQAAPAVASLGGILESITNIQRGMQAVGAALAGRVSTSLTAIQETYKKIVGSTTEISATTARLEDDLVAVQKHYQEIDRLNVKDDKIGLRYFLNFDKIRKWTTQFLREQKQISLESLNQVRQQEEMATIRQDINIIGEKATKQGTSQIDIGEQVAAAWSKTGSSMAESVGSGKEHATIGGMVAAAWSRASSSVRDTAIGFIELLVGIEAIKGAFAAFVDEEVKFSTANYRLYGQQAEIIRQVNVTTVRYGLLRKQVLEAYVAIGASVRTSRLELEKMVQTNVEFSLILGVNEKDLGNWQRAMMGIGIGVKEAKALLTHYAMVMRELGMTAQQLSRILGDQAKSAVMLNFIYGEEGVKYLQKFEVGVQGMGNALNLARDTMDELQESTHRAFTDNAYLMISQSTLTNAELAKIPPRLQQAYKAQSGYSNIIRRATMFTRGLNLETREGFDKAALAATAYGKVFGFTGQSIIAALMIQQKGVVKGKDVFMQSGDEMVRSAMNTRNEIVKNLKGVELEEYLLAEATRNLAYHWGQATSRMDAAWSNLMIALKPAAMFFIDKVLTPIIKALTWFINVLSFTKQPMAEVSSALDKVSASAAPVVTWGQRIGGILGWLAVAGATLAAVWFGFGPALVIWKAFMAATSATKLFAIAAAALAVGAGFLLVAFAFKIMADLGWAIIGPLVATVVVLWGLTAVLPVLTAALTALGTIGWLGIAAMLALSAAFIGVAFAGLMVSWAFQNIAKSLIAIFETTGGALGLVAFGFALAVFGVELITAATTIGIGSILLGLALIPLGLAMAALSVAAMLVSDGALEIIEKLGDGRLQKFGEGLTSLAPGITSFIASMGWGIEFSSGMRGLYAGITKIDPAQVMVTAQSLALFGRALQWISELNVDLTGMVRSVTSFADMISGAFDELKAAVDRAVYSIAVGLFGVTFVIGQLEDQMTVAFVSLLSVIPVITAITNRIAGAIEIGQEKIKSQIDTLKLSFVALESMSSKLGVPATAEEPDKKKVMAETISTVQIKTETAGSASARWKQEEMQAKQTEVMMGIAASVQKISTGNIEDVAAIRALLQTYLPKMGESPSKLSTRLNNWT